MRQTGALASVIFWLSLGGGEGTGNGGEGGDLSENMPYVITPQG